MKIETDQINNVLFQNVTDSNTVTGTNVETDLNHTVVTIPANTIQHVKKKLRLRIWGRYSSAAVLPGTFTLRIKLNGSTVLTLVSFTLLSGASNNGWQMESDITIRTIGSGGIFVINAFHNFSGTGVTDRVTTGNGNKSIDTTIANTFKVSVQFSSASGSNSITAEDICYEWTN